MNITKIESTVREIVRSVDRTTFIYDLMLAYGISAITISRLKKGNLNISKQSVEIALKNKLYFREELKADLHLTVSEMYEEYKYKERFIIVTDYNDLLAIDTKTDDRLDISLKDLAKHYDFFLPWAEMEKSQHQNENPADVKAAEKMAKLFDEIKKDNPDNSPEFIHSLNIFLSRLLFCFFAEDTNIFSENQFTNAIDSHTNVDGSDLDTFLGTLFEVLDTDDDSRSKNLAEYLSKFPYVNGSLFSDKYTLPVFTARSRKAIIASGDLDWSAINPDIFGSMIQAVITPEHRGGLGMHYTSVPNILKVIEPLFLNDLKEEFKKAGTTTKKLYKLLTRIQNIKIFDPACGSGNFLIIAYKELRRLEMQIFKKANILALSSIELSQFYGIELDDFAHEIARLALWLAEHQMNVEFFKEFGRTNPTLPLKEAGHIEHGNACRLDWEKVCPKEDGDEIYIMGNPPYLGARMQDKGQKEDMRFVFGNTIKGINNLDYIACWFYKAARYILKVKSEYAFVTTNSICQGEQVAILWPYILKDGIEIEFAHTSFKWTNNAKGQAAVIVAIIGLSNDEKKQKLIIEKGFGKKVSKINSYLVEANNSFIIKRMKPLSILPDMCFGSMANDGGNLLLSEEEKNEILNYSTESNKYIKKLIGSLELIRGVSKYCLWIEDNEVDDAMLNPIIKNRILATNRVRLGSKREITRELAEYPYRFGEVRYQNTNSIIVPRHSSENREYIPIGFLDKSYVIADSAMAVYNVQSFHLGILSSRMHMTWVRAVAGRLKTDYRYSSSICYNTFPFPNISKKRKEELTSTTMQILEEREKHSDKTLAQLYDPDKMPEGLREAHRLNDEAVERCYRSKPFDTDEERLEYLFKLYEKMIALEKSNVKKK